MRYFLTPQMTLSLTFKGPLDGTLHV
jgi:hypothetical protein